MLKSRLALVALLPFAAAATPALATANTDYSSLTSAVNFGTIATSLVAVAAVIMGILVVRKGIRFVLGSLR